MQQVKGVRQGEKYALVPMSVRGVSQVFIRSGVIVRTNVYREATGRELEGWERWIEDENAARRSRGKEIE